MKSTQSEADGSRRVDALGHGGVLDQSHVKLALSPAASVTLNVIRVLSAQVVVVGHAASFFHWNSRFQAPNAPDIQNIGVVVFFVLSGFLITYSTLQKQARGSYDFRRFFIERFVRIYSGLVPALLVVALLDAIHAHLSPSTYTHGDAYNLPTFVANMGMLQEHPLSLALHRFVPSFPIPTRFGSARPLWTVAVEWWIYLTFGWAFLRGRWSWERVGPVPGIAILVMFAIVPLWNLFGGFGNGLTMTWILGATVAVVLQRNGQGEALLSTLTARARRRLLVVCIGFGLTGFIRIYGFTRDAYDPLFATCLSFALFFLVVGMQSAKTKSTRSEQAIGYFADYSYMLYLLHYSVLECFLPFDDLSPGSRVVLSLVAANLLAALLASATEMKHREWTKRLLLWVEHRGR